MKFNYFLYHARKKVKDGEPEDFHFNLNEILSAYDGLETKLRVPFDHAAEKVFIKKVADPVYLIVKTKDNELIKSINSQNYDIEDIYAKLERNQKIGFASYLYAWPQQSRSKVQPGTAFPTRGNP